MPAFIHGLVRCGVLLLIAAAAQGQNGSAPETALHYINTAFENASPVYWDIAEGGEVNVYLLYDHERESVNRAAGHWHFRVETEKDATLRMVINNLSNYWNGRPSTPAKDASITYVSPDGRSWRAVETELLEGNRLRFEVRVETGMLYVARLEPYRLSDLTALLDEIRGHDRVRITKIGETVEGRPLEIISIGAVDAPYRILIRARAHPWEPGGNWVVQGLILRLLQDDSDAAKYLEHFAVDILPMANKDGVARGLTRFNLNGKDLNREWDRPADAALAPENHALETWIASAIAAGRKPDFMIDLHNDQGGLLHVSRPNIDLEAYLAHMKRFEELLREHSWFTEGATGGSFRNPGSIGEGLLERYGIFACVHELNANWIVGVEDYPSGKHWETYGGQLCEVFSRLAQEGVAAQD